MLRSQEALLMQYVSFAELISFYSDSENFLFQQSYFIINEKKIKLNTLEWKMGLLKTRQIS